LTSKVEDAVAANRSAFSEYEIAYLGPKLDEGRIDLRLISDGIGGFAAMTERSSTILYGQSYDHTAELVASPRRGSVIIPIDIVSHGIKVVEHGWQVGENLLLSPAIQALANLCTLLGIGSVPVAIGLFRMFKTKKGRQLDPVIDDLLLKNLELNLELKRYIRLYNDAEVRSSLRRTLRPLREDGIIEFQTRHRGKVIESVTKADLLSADEAELKDIVEYEERWLDIQKVALVPHLAWHFSGEGQTFDAKIEDEKFWKQVDEGDRYGARDRLRVVLKTTASHDRNGKMHVEQLVTEVLDIEHHRGASQKEMFSDDPRR
jgi:hypothetical protein